MSPLSVSKVYSVVVLLRVCIYEIENGFVACIYFKKPPFPPFVILLKTKLSTFWAYDAFLIACIKYAVSIKNEIYERATRPYSGHYKHAQINLWRLLNVTRKFNIIRICSRWVIFVTNKMAENFLDFSQWRNFSWRQ